MLRYLSSLSSLLLVVVVVVVVVVFSFVCSLLIVLLLLLLLLGARTAALGALGHGVPDAAALQARPPPYYNHYY